MPPWECNNKRRKHVKRKGEDKRYIECLMSIPHTPGSALKNRLTTRELALGYLTRVKFVEEMGRSIREQLVRADPDPQECGREGCFPCGTSKPGQCMRQGVMYRIDCQKCKEEGKTSVYFGESGGPCMTGAWGTSRHTRAGIRRVYL